MLCATCASEKDTWSEAGHHNSTQAQCADMPVQNPQTPYMGKTQENQMVQSTIHKSVRHTAQTGNYALVSHIWSPKPWKLTSGVLSSSKISLLKNTQRQAPTKSSILKEKGVLEQKRQNRKIKKYEGRWQREDGHLQWNQNNFFTVDQMCQIGKIISIKKEKKPSIFTY